MNKNDRRGTSCFLLVCVMAVLILTGCCSVEESSKTIMLPEEEDRLEGLEVKDIKEYSYEDISEAIGLIAWDQDDERSIRILTGADSKGYIYNEEKIRIEDAQVLEQNLVDKRVMSQVKIAPGGRYISYETWEDGVFSLVVYNTGRKEHTIFREWENDEEVLQYAWSGDGRKLFAWQDGNNYGQNALSEWKICSYDMETGMKNEVSAEGIGYSYRDVLPNQDGSYVYIVENLINEQHVENLINNEQHVEEESHQFQHRVANMETGEIKDLGLWDADDARPVKFTEEGVYVQDLEGTISIYTGISQEPVKKELFSIDYKNVKLYICERGDHIFLIEWDSDSEYMQVSAVSIKNGEIVGRGVVYKGISGVDTEAVISPDDHAIAIQSTEYIEDNRWRLKITVLEY